MTECASLLQDVRRERAVAALRQEAARRALGLPEYRFKDLGGGALAMEGVTSGRQFTATICRGRSPRRRCEFCDALCYPRLCDYPTGGPCRKCQGAGRARGKADGLYNCEPCTGTGRRMCNRRVCEKCVAHLEPDEDYCPAHRTLAGFPPLVRRETCRWVAVAWIGSARWAREKCLRESCTSRVTDATARVLYFPDRRRGMCEPCGVEYLRVAV